MIFIEMVSLFLRSIDEKIPKLILDAAQALLNALGSVVIATAVNPIQIVPVIILTAFVILLRMVYLKTSKFIKRFEGAGESKFSG